MFLVQHAGQAAPVLCAVVTQVRRQVACSSARPRLHAVLLTSQKAHCQQGEQPAPGDPRFLRVCAAGRRCSRGPGWGAPRWLGSAVGWASGCRLSPASLEALLLLSSLKGRFVPAGACGALVCDHRACACTTGSLGCGLAPPGFRGTWEGGGAGCGLRMGCLRLCLDVGQALDPESVNQCRTACGGVHPSPRGGRGSLPARRGRLACGCRHPRLPMSASPGRWGLSLCLVSGM